MKNKLQEVYEAGRFHEVYETALALQKRNEALMTVLKQVNTAIRELEGNYKLLREMTDKLNTSLSCSSLFVGLINETFDKLEEITNG
jgi:predicted nuclease with TOPRIM domain